MVLMPKMFKRVVLEMDPNIVQFNLNGTGKPIYILAIK